MPRSGLEPGPPDPESSALTIRPPRLPLSYKVVIRNQFFEAFVATFCNCCTQNLMRNLSLANLGIFGNNLFSPHWEFVANNDLRKQNILYSLFVFLVSAWLFQTEEGIIRGHPRRNRAHEQSINRGNKET